MLTTMSPAKALRPLPTVSAACLAALLACACHVDVTRLRDGEPLDLEAYESLEEGVTTLGEALDKLGAPDEIRAWPHESRLTYLHRDVTRVGVRIQSPISIFGYRHTFAELDGAADDTDRIALTFDEASVLREKSFRLAESTRSLDDAAARRTSWTRYAVPTFAYSGGIAGDGGEADYDELFGSGYLAGLHFAVAPVPYFVLLVGGNYQRFEGDGFRDAGRRIELDDLELWQAEIGGRLQFPPEIFASIFRPDELKALFASERVQAQQGPFLYIKWTVSGTYADSVKVEIDGAPAGTYFDHSVRLSSTAGLGFEFRQGPFGVHVEALYETIGALEEGTVRQGIDTDGDDLSTLLFGGGVSLRF